MRIKLLCLLAMVSQAACVGPIYYIEGSTVLENEAAGEWPGFDRELQRKLKNEGVTFYEDEDSSAARKRALNNINGELIRHE